MCQHIKQEGLAVMKNQQNLLFTMSFNGAAYHGWQIQDNAVSVQGTVLRAFSKLTGEVPVITGCSRTDAKVHANMYCFNVKTSATIPHESFPAALNARLPRDIAVSSCISVPDSFNARFSCKSKEYRYLIYNNEIRNPFYIDKALHYRYPLEEDALDETAGYFTGTYDFSAFCAAGSDAVSKVRTVHSAHVTREGEFVVFTVSADAYLYNMVRIMVGTLLYTAQGKIAPRELPGIIAQGRRELAGPTAPPCGLYLNRVVYNKSEVTLDGGRA